MSSYVWVSHTGISYASLWQVLFSFFKCTLHPHPHLSPHPQLHSSYHPHTLSHGHIILPCYSLLSYDTCSLFFFPYIVLIKVFLVCFYIFFNTINYSYYSVPFFWIFLHLVIQPLLYYHILASHSLSFFFLSLIWNSNVPFITSFCSTFHTFYYFPHHTLLDLAVFHAFPPTIRVPLPNFYTFPLHLIYLSYPFFVLTPLTLPLVFPFLPFSLIWRALILFLSLQHPTTAPPYSSLFLIPPLTLSTLSMFFSADFCSLAHLCKLSTHSLTHTRTHSVPLIRIGARQSLPRMFNRFSHFSSSSSSVIDVFWSTSLTRRN